MEIIKKGDKDKTYTLTCDLCGTIFTMTAEEIANNVFSTVRCPECGNYIYTPKSDKYPVRPFGVPGDVWDPNDLYRDRFIYDNGTGNQKIGDLTIHTDTPVEDTTTKITCESSNAISRNVTCPYYQVYGYDRKDLRSNSSHIEYCPRCTAQKDAPQTPCGGDERNCTNDRHILEMRKDV